METTSSALSLHFAEIYIRLLGHLYSKPHEMNSNLEARLPAEIIFEGEDLYVMKIYDAENQPFTFQWAATLHSFFLVLADRKIESITLERSFHNHPFFQGYNLNFWRQLKYEVHVEIIHSDTVQQVIATLEFIAKTLQERLEDDGWSHSLLFFRWAATHVWLYRQRDVDYKPIGAAVDSLIPILFRFKTLLDAPKLTLELERFGDERYDPEGEMEPFTKDWWDILFLPDDENKMRPSGSSANISQVENLRPRMDVVEGSGGPLLQESTHHQPWHLPWSEPRLGFDNSPYDPLSHRTAPPDCDPRTGFAADTLV